MVEDSISDIGTVVKIDGNIIQVRIDKSGGCSSCSMHALCGSGDKSITLEFTTEETYQIGDKVIVHIAPITRVISSLIVFGLPIVGLVSGYLLSWPYVKEPISIAIGFITLLLMFFVIKLLDKKATSHIHFTLGGKFEDMSK